MSDREYGLTLDVHREELKAMMLTRAEAHQKRVQIHEERIKQLAKLMKTGAEALLPTVAQTVALAADETDDGVPTGFIDLSNSSVRDLNHHVTYARDRARAHQTAALWLRFAAAHLVRDSYTFRSDDSLLAYLVDVNHPTAMPNYRLIERGVQ